ncbi:MAG: radical SAM protein [Phycisphaerae bacterium]|nr:radical SAM protein [Phycisphaerae bacterium]
MELPSRTSGDQRLRAGELRDICARLRRLAPKHDLTGVIACAFDHRTRMLPFIVADMWMAPAGVRAIGSAMVASGFDKTRIVLQQWSPNFRPSRMRLDGRVPDLFMVSSMQIHTAACHDLLRDACTIDPAVRPLIIAGGPKVIYEPWDVFSNHPAVPRGADVAVTGEEYVLLQLLEVLLTERADGEPLRKTFFRARDAGLLDTIPGLVYANGQPDGPVEELVDTGIQRLIGDLDEIPHPALGYRLLEMPSARETLGVKPIPPGRVRYYSRMGGLVLTLGCKFTCPYCPIPAYNQRLYRVKSGRRIAEEMIRLYREFGLQYFFGADDNFFNAEGRTLDIVETLSGTQVNGKPFHKTFRWATEVTVYDTLKMREHLRTVRKAGVVALWLGVEDMTGTLVKKGQTVDNTREAFRLLRERSILPMPMMMHHDDQPLYTRGRPEGLLNQVRLLRQAGAISLQVLMITPATGSKLYEEAYTSGKIFRSVGGRTVEQRMLDGNYVVASHHAQPWRKQFNLLIAYLFFYNPARFIKAVFFPKSRLYLPDSGMQLIGMWGLVQTIRRTIGWAFRLMRGKIRRRTAPPVSPIPMRDPTGAPAAHALPGTKLPSSSNGNEAVAPSSESSRLWVPVNPAASCDV